MNTITSKQWFQIISGIVSGLVTSAALLQTLFGQDLTLKIVAGLGIVGIILSSVGTTFSTQASLVKDVAAMPGVSSVQINAQASQAVAQVAVDAAQPKVQATASSEQQVTQIARGA